MSILLVNAICIGLAYDIAITVFKGVLGVCVLTTISLHTQKSFLYIQK